MSSSTDSLPSVNRELALIRTNYGAGWSPDNARAIVHEASGRVREVRSAKSSKSSASLAESLLWRGDLGAAGAGAGASESLRSTEEEEPGRREAAMAFLNEMKISPLGSRKADAVLQKCVYKCSSCFLRVIPKRSGVGELLCMYDPLNNQRYFDFSIGLCPECQSELE